MGVEGVTDEVSFARIRGTDTKIKQLIKFGMHRRGLRNTSRIQLYKVSVKPGVEL